MACEEITKYVHIDAIVALALRSAMLNYAGTQAHDLSASAGPPAERLPGRNCRVGPHEGCTAPPRNSQVSLQKSENETALITARIYRSDQKRLIYIVSRCSLNRYLHSAHRGAQVGFPFALFIDRPVVDVLGTL